ncbi:MAG: carbon-nitrogen hydrolase family protein [Armatimonadetes bacterium]|nr:carbon-nitrogen hydrolase family protein [Armatimonadota bacterium]
MPHLLVLLLPGLGLAADEWAAANLVTNSDFAQVAGALPVGWEAVCRNPALAPRFAAAKTPDGKPSLTAAGNGRRECFGYVRHAVQLEGGKTYRLRVRLRYEGLDDLNRHLLHGIFADGFNDGVFSYRKMSDGSVVGEGRFPGPAQAVAGEVRLYFRFSATGRVAWEQVALQECPPFPPRPVKIACTWGGGDLAHWSRWLDLAGQRGCDLALLPEMLNGKGVKDAEPLDGPTGKLLAAKARQWRMYVCGTFYQQRGDLVYNTAPLFGRNGQLVGTYSKNQLFDPEEDQGATPGSGFPVFHTDFGEVGIMICYDMWFPEPARLLAYRGAELVLAPNAGYYTALMPARAADNGLWFAASSLNCPAGVWDSAGACAGEAEPNPTRYVATSVTGFESDAKHHLLIATVDLSRRWSPHWWGGPMLSAPGGRRVRQTLIDSLEPAIVREAERWWDE